MPKNASRLRRGYTLLTGATGLLGRYLLRDLLLEERPVAVLVRANRRSAHERIDGILDVCEQQLGRALPRPIVLQGDLAEEQLGLSAESRAWLGQYCTDVIHSAASLKFYEEDGEPWRTNVDGVAKLLDVCRVAGIRDFHHISSSYVCGRRMGRVLESELDVGQEFGNDYETSKARAEKLVREANFLNSFTILRPSIIVGDSHDGFSSTFHGFYTPLRLITALLTQVSHQQLFGVDFLGMLGLNGTERKNFVPVDWVSAAMLAVLHRNQRPNQTFAFVTEEPVTTRRLLETFRRATEGQGRVTPSGTSLPQVLSGSDKVIQAYTKQHNVYRSYWKDDAEFDATNTSNLIPDLTCPRLSDETLDMLASVAIEQRFNWLPAAKIARFDTQAWLDSQQQKPIARNGRPHDEPSFVLSVSGSGGGAWTITTNGAIHATVGVSDSPNEVRLQSQTLSELASGTRTLRDAIQTGQVVLYGSQPLNTLAALLPPQTAPKS
jgi:thioester reductase-like protein